MRVLVTGASGFAGAALCRALSEVGEEVVALCRSPARGREQLPAKVSVVAGSIAHPAEIAQAAEGCQVVFHAAGITDLRASPRVLRWVHVAGTENVLRAARHAGVQRVVHLSCADVSLCDEDRMHWDETRVLTHDPVGDHARTKLMAEELALSASDDTLEVTALRPAWLWGPGDTDGIARLAVEAQTGGVHIYGGGRNILALTHIENLVRAAITAATAADAPARAYYITDGEFADARELLPRILEACALPGKLRDHSLGRALLTTRARRKLGWGRGDREAEILRRGRSALFDLSRARKDLDYTPSVDFPEALRALASWVQNQGGPARILERARPAPKEADVDAQVAAAGGD